MKSKAGYITRDGDPMTYPVCGICLMAVNDCTCVASSAGGWNQITEIVSIAGTDDEPVADMVEHPPHYNDHPSGVECIDIVQHMNFCRGNAVKYIWRAGAKGDEVEDLRKAKRYLEYEIERLTKA